MKKLLLLLSLIDFFIGLLFGNIGHFYSILCFPLIALIRGYIGATSGPRTLKHSIFLSLIGGSFFFIGLVIGMIMLSSRIPADKANELMSLEALGQSLTMSIVSAFVYFAFYMFFGILSGFLCKEVCVLKKTGVNSKGEI